MALSKYGYRSGEISKKRSRFISNTLKHVLWRNRKSGFLFRSQQVSVSNSKSNKSAQNQK